MGGVFKSNDYYMGKFKEKCGEIGVDYIKHKEIESTNRKRRFIITYKCEIHGIVDVSCEYLRKATDCKNCKKEKDVQNRRIDFKIIIKKFKEMNLILLSNEKEYKNALSKLYYTCPMHPDKTLFTTWDAIRKGHGCRFCHYERSRKLDTDKIKEKCEENNYTFLENNIYENDNYELKFICNNHPELNEQKSSVYNFLLNNHACKKCILEMKSKSHREDFEKVEQAFVDKNCVLISTEDEYVNNETPLRYLCLLHPEEGVQYKNYRDMKRAVGCGVCAHEQRITTHRMSNEEFLKKVFDQVGNEYTFLENYIKSDVKIKVVHNKCGHNYYVTPSNFINKGKRCPLCASSKGEEMVHKVLKENNIQYVSEYKFNDCKNILPLPFDFAILEDNKTVRLLIEYQGSHHYEPVQYFGGEERFRQTLINDDIKRDYCRRKKIPLLEIPHWEFDNIELIILNKLNIKGEIL